MQPYIFEVILMIYIVIWTWLGIPLPWHIQVGTLTMLVPKPTQTQDPCLQLFQSWSGYNRSCVSGVGIKYITLTLATSKVQIYYLRVFFEIIINKTQFMDISQNVHKRNVPETHLESIWSPQPIHQKLQWEKIQSCCIRTCRET